jgi:nucleoid-associated protein YgaU
MARPKKTVTKRVSVKTSNSPTYFDKLEQDIKSNNSPFSLILGALIVIVIGVLLFNFFSQKNQDLGPAQQTEQAGDVAPDKLPGKYTVKDGDTLFTIADNYYKDGYKFEEIAKANNITDVNALIVGQVLEIPKIDGVAAVSASPEASASPTAVTEASPAPTDAETGTGGGDTTIWGSRITGDTYTVVDGDWLSTIAGRAYGDVMAYQKIAAANNISNPDVITPGQVLKLPR